MIGGPMISAAGRNTVFAALAGLALVATSASPSAAASSVPVSAKVVTSGHSDVTDFSAARRHRYYRRGSNAAGLAFMGAAAGIIGGVIAESRRREYYEDRYYYGPGPYYGGGPGYYGGGPYYGPRGYYQPY